MINKVIEVLSMNNPELVKSTVEEALEAGLTANQIINEGLVVGMNGIGKRFRAGEIFVPEVLVSAMGMQMALERLKPLLKEGENQAKGKVIFATVQGDIHDIGKNLCCIMLEGAGYDVIDLGTDVSKEVIANAIQEHNPDVVGLSALLTTTMTEMPVIESYLQEVGMRGKIKLVYGGAPITSKWAEDHGADGYSEDAAECVELVAKFVS